MYNSDIIKYYLYVNHKTVYMHQIFVYTKNTFEQNHFSNIEFTKLNLKNIKDCLYDYYITTITTCLLIGC